MTARLAADHPYPRAFLTVSGAHLYGFPSKDSDIDLRGVHVLPLEEIVGLDTGDETITLMWDHDGVEADAVTHDLAKFCALLLRRNGYVLEQVMSPLVVATSEVHAELKALVPGLVTSNHAHHYLGFARSQWQLFERSRELKPLLYTFRVLLTGIHLMRTGEVEADLTHLTGPSYMPDLIEAKRAAEHGALPEDAPGTSRLHDDVAALTTRLEDERGRSDLPEFPANRRALHDLVVRTRLR
ncbi:nucleotidyltransferase domain-containing protein [Actinomadura sp. BRA 177]|nr:nucleotidyltransferase domain-containing protein [Actinomadura sp. BRA 177]